MRQVTIADLMAYAGIRGNRGDRGETGPAGPTGPEGPAGYAGSCAPDIYTPVAPSFITIPHIGDYNPGDVVLESTDHTTRMSFGAHCELIIWINGTKHSEGKATEKSADGYCIINATSTAIVIGAGKIGTSFVVIGQLMQEINLSCNLTSCPLLCVSQSAVRVDAHGGYVRFGNDLHSFGQDEYSSPPPGKSFLNIQSDCDMVFHGDNHTIWSSNTTGRGRNCRAIFDHSGRFAIRNDDGITIWVHSMDPGKRATKWGLTQTRLYLFDDDYRIVFNSSESNGTLIGLHELKKSEFITHPFYLTSPSYKRNFAPAVGCYIGIDTELLYACGNKTLWQSRVYHVSHAIMKDDGLLIHGPDGMYQLWDGTCENK